MAHLALVTYFRRFSGYLTLVNRAVETAVTLVIPISVTISSAEIVLNKIAWFVREHYFGYHLANNPFTTDKSDRLPDSSITTTGVVIRCLFLTPLRFELVPPILPAQLARSRLAAKPLGLRPFSSHALCDSLARRA